MFCSRQVDYSGRRCSNSKKFQGRAHGRRARRDVPPEKPSLCRGLLNRRCNLPSHWHECIFHISELLVRLLKKLHFGDTSTRVFSSHGYKDKFSIRELLIPLFKDDLMPGIKSTDFTWTSEGLSAFTSLSAPLPTLARSGLANNDVVSRRISRS
jgi:hypothetical protein